MSTIEVTCERRAHVLRLKLNGVNGEFVGRLQGMLAGYRGGQTSVRLSYRNAEGQAEIKLGAEWRVRAGPGLRDALLGLEGVLGAEILFA